LSFKRHAAGHGVVANADLSTIYQREIFFQVDPMTLDVMDWSDLHEQQPSGLHLEFDPTKFLVFLPELEAEIFWLIYFKKKNQADIARLLDLSQPTISYRYRRVLVKLKYLMTLSATDVKEMVDELFFLREHEKAILYDLFYYTNQEMVGKRHGVRQSSVKWIFVKTKRRLENLERDDTKWFNHLGIMIFLEKNLGIRVLH
jgi:hypothetical protein